MRVLFISRAYPPSIGGIEKQNLEIYQALSNIDHVELVANKRGKVFLPIFLLIALYKIIQRRQHYDIILLGDGVLAIIAFFSKALHAKPVVCILHGLDVTYRNYFFQLIWVGYFFNKIDKFITVGNETIVQAVKRGLAVEKTLFIPNGVNVDHPVTTHTRAELSVLLGIEPPGAILLTLGRLVQRKGVVWFIENVITKLDPTITYIVAGQGREEKKILALINKHKLEPRVIFLGKVSDAEKSILFSTADLFIQPNIPVKNDMEGFGLVVLEAARSGTFVVAADLEGLKDAITPGKNGLLIEPCNAQAFREGIESLLSDPKELTRKSKVAHEFTTDNYSWHKISQLYSKVLQKELKSSDKA